MKLPGWLIIICIVSVIGIITGAIFNFQNYGTILESEPSSVIDFSENGTIGYVIKNGSSIYFISEKELLAKYGETMQLDELPKIMGHPTNTVLQGKTVEAIKADLKTGDKVEIWYTVTLESFPGKIRVEKIRKL